MLNSLVAYKGKAARIVSQNNHKFELQFAPELTRSVREKDFRFIHPEFIQVSDICPQADMAVLADFQEESLSLQEITEWLFNEYCAQNAWCAYLLVEDGLYFYWQKNMVFVRPNAQVEQIQTKREATKLEAKLLAHCADNIRNNTFDEQDLPIIQSIERVALNQSKYAKILTLIGVENTPEAAYQLLVKLRVFDPSFNPYPQRHGILKDEEIAISPVEIDRVDLTHLTSYAIDNIGSVDADDAISIDAGKIWVHVADVANIVTAGSFLDEYAQQRATNLYLPEQTIHMLPISITSACALGMSEISSALSVGFRFESGVISDIEVVHSQIKATTISYEVADDKLPSDTHLLQLQSVAEAHQKHRDDSGAISLNLPRVNVKFKANKASISAQVSSISRDLVAEMMIMAGRAIAQFSIENNIVMPYSTQDVGEFSQAIIADKHALSLSASFKAMQYFKRSTISTKPQLHYGLGLDAYLRVTSPLRRYFDLLAQQQLSNFILGKETLAEERVQEIIGIINATMPNVNKAISASNEHYKCLYLLDNPNWQGEGVVVDLRGDKALLIIPALSMMTKIKIKTLPKLDACISLKITTVDLAKRLVNFKTL